MDSVAVIVLDTLRKDTFDRHFDWLEGQRYERAFSTANWTVPAHASLFTGKYASSVGVDAKHQLLDCDRPVLAEQLRDAGYRTRAISANQNVSSKGNWDRGFDEFVNPSRLFFRDGDVLDWEEFLSTTDAADLKLYLQAVGECFTADCSTLRSLRAGFEYYRSGLQAASDVDDYGAEEVLDVVREWRFDGDEFLYVNLMETHTPYDPPAGYPGADRSITVDIEHSLGLEGAPDDTDRVYDGAAQYLSDVTRELYEALRPDFDVVVFLSDHGEMLGEGGLYNHTYGLHPSVVRVPLVVCGVDDPRRDTTTRSILDVYATVLDVAGADVPDDVDGASLFDPPAADRYLAEYRGLLFKAVEQLEDAGVDPDTIERFEEPLVGAVLPEGYVYESKDGIVESGDVDESAAGVVRQATRYLNRANTTESASTEAPAVPERHLENLGYM
jgi:arylsulfatase A-like enzyme